MKPRTVARLVMLTMCLLCFVLGTVWLSQAAMARDFGVAAIALVVLFLGFVCMEGAGQI